VQIEGDPHANHALSFCSDSRSRLPEGITVSECCPTSGMYRPTYS
jgi:hypothetical protein